MPGRRTPLVLDHSTPELQLLQRVRDEAHRFAVTHHRIRRDRAMTASLLDDLPGIGPARKQALLAHFGSPEAVAAASSEELQAVPGLPAKVARELFATSTGLDAAPSAHALTAGTRMRVPDQGRMRP